MKSYSTAAGIFILAALYVAAAKLGFTVAFQAEQVTVVWPPTGISLAALLVLGIRFWPGVLLGAFLANITSHETIAVASGIAAGNTLEALMGAWLLHRFRFIPELRSIRDVLQLTLCSAVFSTAIGATIGVSSLCAGGLQPWSACASLWLQWWLGDTSGALIVTPVLVVWAAPSTARWLKHHGAEMLALLAVLTIASLDAFSQLPVIGTSGHAFIYLIFPFIIWAAIRLGQRGTTLVTLTLCAIAVWATVHGFGPFGGDSPDQRLILLQLFMMIASVTGMCLGAAVTERRAAEESAQETRKLLAAIVESSEDAVISHDLNGIINSWNAAAESLFGYHAEEVIGQHIKLLIPEGREGESRSIIRELQAGHPIKHFETVRMTKATKPINVSLTISPVRNAAGTIIGASKISRDITLRKHTEAKLKAAMEELTAAGRAKDDFLANMSHEIRTPLTSIIGTSELLANTTLSSEQSEYAETINTAGDTLLSLINNILDYSKIESGGIEILQKPVMLRTLLKEVMQMIAERAEAGGITLSITCPDEVPLIVLGDAMRLKQILLNLGGNAVKFCGRGQVTIRVEAMGKESQESKIWLRFSVEDTGQGIPADKLAFIFEKFTQLNEFATKRNTGTGLGLAICKRLVEKMGGTIHVESTLGKGSTFWFDLPFTLDSTQGADEASMRLLLQDKRALLIDGFAQNRRNMLEYFMLLGIRCDIVSSVQDALLKLETWQRQKLPYHLVFVDDSLPETKPEKILLTMQLFQSVGDPRLVLLTSFTPDTVPEHLRRAPFAAYVSKPVDLSMLFNTIISVLGDRLNSESLSLAPVLTDQRKKITRHFCGRVLLVEDYPPNRLMARRMLEKIGCAVEVAQNGEEALAHMAHERYDVVLMDCQMPEMDGFQTTAEIRKREGDEHTIIIAMTANALNGDRERCLNIGMDDYLSKPIRSAELIQVLGKYLTA